MKLAEDVIDHFLLFLLAIILLNNKTFYLNFSLMTVFHVMQVDLERIAKDIRGYVGADLATLCTDAALQCRREKMGIIY